MVFVAAVLVLVSPILSCSTTVPSGATQLSSQVYVERLEPGLWRHVSHRFVPTYGNVPSNGLIVRARGGALVIDTAWNNEQTASVLDWAEENVGPVLAVVVTHSHEDRIGGIENVHERGIPSYGLEATSALAVARGKPNLTHTFSEASVMSLSKFGVTGEVFYPGPGHTVDNIVIWLERYSTLFGSCTVRGAKWNLGNLDDAAPKKWLRSSAVLVERYRRAQRVVPGHGEPGGTELLVRTRNLVEEIQ